ncbi:MAG TPA: helix-turn-helix transcriptional regulator [Burkholderiales bacterium]|nr:helix-turn-helix transcriptional regulator [Burkholderiales bacterium]
MNPASQPVGALLREWRQRRRMTQMDLALEADISPRHLSFVETGRSQPSREMLLHLFEELEVPLRERNRLLVAAGYAPMYRERALDDDALAAARAAVQVVLEAQKPFPAFALDRCWNVVASNGALPQLFAGVAEELLQPLNAMRVSLHPRGLAPVIENFAEWRAHLLSRLRRQVELTADPALSALLAEVAGYPAPDDAAAKAAFPDLSREVLVPLRLRTPAGTLSFFSTTTVFGTPVDVTLSELAIESFFPADEDTRRRVEAL